PGAGDAAAELAAGARIGGGADRVQSLAGAALAAALAARAGGADARVHPGRAGRLRAGRGGAPLRLPARPGADAAGGQGAAHLGADRLPDRAVRPGLAAGDGAGLADAQPEPADALAD